MVMKIYTELHKGLRSLRKMKRERERGWGVILFYAFVSFWYILFRHGFPFHSTLFYLFPFSEKEKRGREKKREKEKEKKF